MYNFRATHTLTPQLLIHQNHWTSQKWHRRISLFGAIGVEILTSLKRVKHQGMIVNLLFIICKQLAMSSIKVWLSIYFSLFASSLFLSALKTSISPLSKKSISQENFTYLGHKLPAAGSSIVSVSKHQVLVTLFCYIWKQKHILIMTK